MRAPKAPDPVAVSQAQAGMNRDTAITSGQLSMIDQVNPWGSTTYQQTGENTFIDSQGNEVTTPKYTQTTSFSPSQQAIYDRTQQAEQNLAQIAQDQSGFLTGYLKGGIDLSGAPDLQSSFGPGYKPNFNGNLGLQTDAGLQTSVGPGYATSYAGADDFSADRQRVEDALWDRMAGDRASQEASLRTQLANKGIQEGSAAWNSEMERLQRQNTDARLATIAAGGQEQQRMVDMARQAAMFGNDSILGRFGAENAAQLAQAQFGNEAKQAQGVFGMGAQQAQNAAVAEQAGMNNQARQQAVAEQFALRNQPLNEISALLSGTQVSNPAQMSAAAPQINVGGVDYTGLVSDQYKAKMAGYQSMLGGLGGLAGLALGPQGFLR